MIDTFLRIFSLLQFTSLCSSVSSPRIVGGFTTAIQNYGYTVSLQYEGSHVCGGSIISPTIIASAAHCIRFAPEMYSIRAGSTYSDKGGDIYGISNIVKHPKYNRDTADKDVCLIFLSKQIVYNSNIRTVRLPFYRQVVPTNETTVVTGWGTTEVSSPRLISSQLKGVFLKIKDLNFCKSLYPPNSITDSMICAGSTKAEDACSGDSGGPMVLNGSLVGIVSWGFSCADVAYPGVFTYVPHVMDFIYNYTNTLTVG